MKTRLLSGSIMTAVSAILAGFFYLLKATVAISLTATVIMVPGTQKVSDDGTKPLQTPLLQRELSGWVYNPASDCWVTDLYPRAMGKYTGPNDPTGDVSVGLGVAALENLISVNLLTNMVVFGYSQGAIVSTKWLNDHANGKDPSAPLSSNLSFVSIGNPNRPNGGLLARMPGLHIPGLGITFNGATTESQYKLTDVVRQYDLFADFPVDPLNVLSLLNVIADAGAVHGNYLSVNVNDSSNWVSVDANTTYIMEPAAHLPLLQPLRNFAALHGRTQTPLIDAIEPILRYFVELGYDRTNQNVSTTFQPGSSMSRFFQTLPQFAQSLRQGADILKSGLHQSTVPSTVSNQSIFKPSVKTDMPSALQSDSQISVSRRRGIHFGDGMNNATERINRGTHVVTSNSSASGGSSRRHSNAANRSSGSSHRGSH